MHAMYVSPELTVTDSGGSAGTPPDALTGDPAGFLDRVARVMPQGGVLVLHPGAAGLAGLPVEASDNGAECGRWSTRRVQAWSTWQAQGRPLLRVVLTHLLETPVEMGLWVGPSEGGPFPTVANLSLWHRLTGVPAHGDPTRSGSAILRDTLPQKGRHQPTWKPQNPGPDGFEDDFRVTHWRAKKARGQYLHGWDFNRAYVAAAANVRVAKRKLERGPRTFDRTLGGWWLIETAPWNDDRLPDPAGYDPHGRILRWVTTPTVELLQELTDEGVYGGVRVVESWVAPGSTLLRPLAHRLRDSYAGIDPRGRTIQAPEHRMDAVQSYIKDTGRAVFGAFNSNTNWIYRPDWWYSIVAMARCNLWRKIYRTTAFNRFPIRIDVDCVWYPSDESDPDKALPPGWERDDSGMRLGCVKHMGRRIRKMEGVTQ